MFQSLFNPPGTKIWNLALFTKFGFNSWISVPQLSISNHPPQDSEGVVEGWAEVEPERSLTCFDFLFLFCYTTNQRPVKNSRSNIGLHVSLSSTWPELFCLLEDSLLVKTLVFALNSYSLLLTYSGGVKTVRTGLYALSEFKH